MFQTEVIHLGGGVSGAGERIPEPIQNAIKEKAFARFDKKHTEIKIASLGNDAGIIGATTLWEDFWPDNVYSMNHHFWGDISAWFIKCIAGIRLNPSGNDVSEVEIRPSFINDLVYAEAFHISPKGKITSSWKKRNNKIFFRVEIPQEMCAKMVLENGYLFKDGTSEKRIATGEYELLTPQRIK